MSKHNCHSGDPFNNQHIQNLQIPLVGSEISHWENSLNRLPEIRRKVIWKLFDLRDFELVKDLMQTDYEGKLLEYPLVKSKIIYCFITALGKYKQTTYKYNKLMQLLSTYLPHREIAAHILLHAGDIHGAHCIVQREEERKLAIKTLGWAHILVLREMFTILGLEIPVPTSTCNLDPKAVIFIYLQTCKANEKKIIRHLLQWDFAAVFRALESATDNSNKYKVISVSRKPRKRSLHSIHCQNDDEFDKTDLPGLDSLWPPGGAKESAPSIPAEEETERLNAPSEDYCDVTQSTTDGCKPLHEHQQINTKIQDLSCNYDNCPSDCGDQLRQKACDKRISSVSDISGLNPSNITPRDISDKDVSISEYYGCRFDQKTLGDSLYKPNDMSVASSREVGITKSSNSTNESSWINVSQSNFYNLSSSSSEEGFTRRNNYLPFSRRSGAPQDDHVDKEFSHETGTCKRRRTELSPDHGMKSKREMITVECNIECYEMDYPKTVVQLLEKDNPGLTAHLWDIERVIFERGNLQITFTMDAQSVQYIIDRDFLLKYKRMFVKFNII